MSFSLIKSVKLWFGYSKGTLSYFLLNAQEYKKVEYIHLSAGDLLRAERQRPGSEFGEEIEGHIKNGSIVPVEITCSLLKRVRNVNCVAYEKDDCVLNYI